VKLLIILINLCPFLVLFSILSFIWHLDSFFVEYLDAFAAHCVKYCFFGGQVKWELWSFCTVLGQTMEMHEAEFLPEPGNSGVWFS